ncbi:PapB/FocB family fimbrial expression transcriptional regulator [Escherichia coli]|uniref:PapB/FocB family fimbrial expression transcriptional regulator n=1 Tax=Escherichia coli TaxID=562 RepID=UPI00191859E5|nr:PapB/FocB family fimbrial expression transcriptional regulator [Escherichia coli]
MLNNLIPGSVDKSHFYLLLSLTSINSERIRSALEQYFVYGAELKNVCKDFDVNVSYFSLKVRVIQDVSRTVLTLYPYYENLYREIKNRTGSIDGL